MDVYIRVLCNRAGLDYYEKLLAEKVGEKTLEEEPMKDEELDKVIDQFLDTKEEFL
jgi:hypothetical protein